MAEVHVDCRGETCPIPLIEVRKALRRAAPGDVVEVIGTHHASKREIPVAVKNLGMEVLEVKDEGEDGVWCIRIQR